MKCVQTRNNFKAQELDCNAGNSGWIPGSGRSPWGKTGYPVQHSCLENSMDRGFWWAIVLESQSVGRDWGINTHFFSKPFSMWINKLSHTILKLNELLLYAKAFVHFKVIILSEISQTKRYIYSTITFI